MKTKNLPLVLAVLVAGTILGVISWMVGSANTPKALPQLAAWQHHSVPVTQLGDGIPPPPTSPPPTKIEGGYISSAGDPLASRLNRATSAEMPQILAQIDHLPDSPVKDDLLLSALKKWAKQDGAAAIQWASQRPQLRGIIPDLLQEWAGVGAEAAAKAWQFAKQSVGADGDTVTWLSPKFVSTAFGSMAAIPGAGVWQELKGLSGTSQLNAMMGMADFASNRQTNTEFASDFESRMHDLESPTLAASFYAAAGHIQAAKDDLASVSDSDQWRAIAREIAKQQAVFEPSKAIDWLAAQFPQPADAIDDMVESIGMTQALNAGDVLNWLKGLPASNQQASGIAKILGSFPELRTDLAVQSIVVNP